MKNSILNVLKSKAFFMSLLVANSFVFGVGLYYDNLDLILLAGMSFATVLLSMELSKDEDKE